MDHRKLPEDGIEELHERAIENGFQWLPGERVPNKRYTPGFAFSRRAGFRMKKEHNTEEYEEYRPGSYVSVQVASKEHCKGDIGGPSVAKILDVLEDQHGCCHVALHYFWKWGQIHAGAEQHPSVRPRHTAQIFLQDPVTRSPVMADGDWHSPVYDEDGTYKEVIAAVFINHKVSKVVVLTRDEVESSYGPGGLDTFEHSFPGACDPASGSRDNGFWYQHYYDHTAYTFTTVPGAVSEAPGQLLDECRLTMADFFCGPGTVSLAARAAGWAVLYGVDCHRACCSSFTENTVRQPGQPPFNPSAVPREPQAVCKRIEQLEVEVLQGEEGAAEGGLPLVEYIHGSPPCQNLSRRKKDEKKHFSGAELRAFVNIVTHYLPAFVSLEEVPGFIWHMFPSESLQGPLAGYPNPPPAAPARAPAGATSTDAAGHTTAGGAAQAGRAAAFDDSHCGEPSSDEELDEPDDDMPVNESVSPEAAKGKVSFNPCLLVVPQLLDAGYQVRIVMVNALSFGAPQSRWRVVLFAARHGFQLPQPPAPRYKVPGYVRREMVSSVDPNFMPKDGVDPMPWNDVLTPRAASPAAVAAAVAAADGDVVTAPVVASGSAPERDTDDEAITVQEAIGDLPPIMQQPSSSYSNNSLLQQLPASAAATRNGADAAAAAATDVEEADIAAQQQPEQQPAVQLDLTARLSAQQQASKVNLQQLRSAAAAVDEKRKQAPYLGWASMPYQPQAGVLSCQLPPPLSSHHQPASRFARFMRSPHWEGQELLSFNCGLLEEHIVNKPPRKRRAMRRLHPCHVSGTVLGHNDERGAWMHFAEHRMLTTLERRRLMSLPDWLRLRGRAAEVEQQVGNAVPYLLAVELTASVMEAATGRPAPRPPNLAGPCEQGTGITDLVALEKYEKWVGQQGWPAVVQQCREALVARLQGFKRDLTEDTEQEPQPAGETGTGEPSSRSRRRQRR